MLTMIFENSEGQLIMLASDHIDGQLKDYYSGSPIEDILDSDDIIDAHVAWKKHWNK